MQRREFMMAMTAAPAIATLAAGGTPSQVSAAADTAPSSGPPTDYTARLAAFAAATSFDSLPPDIVHATKRVILDTIATAIGGYKAPGGKIVADLARRGPPEATVLGVGAPASVSEAVMANGYLGNALDGDDNFMYNGHPSTCSVMPALALAESRRLSGKQFLTAVALGYEVGGRILTSSKRWRTAENGTIEQTAGGTLAVYVFCAAAAAGKCVGLDADGFRNALGIVALATPLSFGPRWQNIASGKNMAKYSPNGSNGLNGVRAAELAERGFTGDPAILDGPFSYYEAVGAFGVYPELLLGDLGTKWSIAESCIKPYAAGRYVDEPVRLFIDLCEAHDLHPDQIDHVEVLVIKGVTGPWFTVREPVTAVDMEFSIPLAIGAKAYGSDLGPDWVSPAMIQDAKIRAFARKVDVAEHPDGAGMIEKQLMSGDHNIRSVPYRVTITAGGQSYAAESLYAWGDPWPGARPMTDDDVKTKVRTFTRDLLPSAKVEALIQAIYGLETVADVAADLSPLLRA